MKSQRPYISGYAQKMPQCRIRGIVECRIALVIAALILEPASSAFSQYCVDPGGPPGLRGSGSVAQIFYRDSCNSLYRCGVQWKHEPTKYLQSTLLQNAEGGDTSGYPCPGDWRYRFSGGNLKWYQEEEINWQDCSEVDNNSGSCEYIQSIQACPPQVDLFWDYTGTVEPNNIWDDPNDAEGFVGQNFEHSPYPNANVTDQHTHSETDGFLIDSDIVHFSYTDPYVNYGAVFSTIYYLTQPYTDDILHNHLEQLLPAYGDDWTTGVPVAYFGADPDWGSGCKMQYYIHADGASANTTYVFNWQEVRYYSYSQTFTVTAKQETVRASGDPANGVSTSIHDVPLPFPPGEVYECNATVTPLNQSNAAVPGMGGVGDYVATSTEGIPTR